MAREDICFGLKGRVSTTYESRVGACAFNRKLFDFLATKKRYGGTMMAYRAIAKMKGGMHD